MYLYSKENHCFFLRHEYKASVFRFKFSKIIKRKIKIVPILYLHNVDKIFHNIKFAKNNCVKYLINSNKLCPVAHVYINYFEFTEKLKKVKTKHVSIFLYFSALKIDLFKCYSWRGGRVVEGARLESVYTSKGYRGFESHSLRQK